MIRRSVRPRSGVTLTEILISILILGVGLVSLATLFPLGLLRIRTAQRLTRSTYLAESAVDELKTRGLLNKFSFTNRFNTPYAVTGAAYPYYDPWVQDTPQYGTGAFDNMGNSVGAAASIAPGLPVAYDPLWWNVVGNRTPAFFYNNNNTAAAGSTEGRFANGMGFLRPNGTAGPSANGLQRLNNLPGPGSPFTNAAQQQQQYINYQIALYTFVSPEDIVFQDPKGKYTDPTGSFASINNPSPVVPDLSQVQANSAMTIGTANGPVNVYPPQTDWRYTWMVTGNQRDVINGSIFDINIVVHENRAFGMDTVNSPNGSVLQPTGETVVEAVWGYGKSVVPFQNPSVGYAVGAKRTVLLLWDARLPDPDVRVGQWIADVTYERVQTLATARFPSGAISPAQRCYWYQIAKRTDPGPATSTVQAFVGGTTYRQMTVWVTNDLDAQSLLYTGGGGPVNVEAALIAPSVVNVIPRQVYN